MSTSPDSNRCSRCGGSTAPSTSGRITQWVVACTCKLTDVTPSQSGIEVTANVIICQNCGKRMEQGRVGSFTQWVFRSDICACDNPQPMSQEIQVVSGPQIAQPDADLENEPGLNIDPDKFPHERYKPFTLIGKGASGTVYLCWDKLLAKRVAIKVLHHLESSQLVAFQQEARTMSRLNHENIIKVFDFGATEGGVPFMVMELIKGASVMNYIVEFGCLLPPAAVYFIRQVCLGLSHAHSVGVFHRDIKSSNILVSNLGTEQADAILIDFGVADFKTADQEPTITQGTEMVGSPYYMAPDLALGLKYSERSEIYSLGCCLFEALTGKVPFEGASPLEVISLHAKEEPPTLSETAPGVEFSAELEHLVARCLSKKPDDRYANTEELAAALKSLPEYRGKDLVVQPQSSLDKTTFDPSQFPFPGKDSEPKKPWKNPIAILATVAAAITLGALVTTALSPTKTPYQVETKLYSSVFNDIAAEKLADKPKGTKTIEALEKPPALVALDENTEEAVERELMRSSFKPTIHKIKQPHEFRITTDSNGNVEIRGLGDVRDEDLAQLKGKKFDHFSIDQCNVTGTGFKYLRSTGVSVVCAESCNVNDEGLKELGQIKTLRVAYLRGNQYTGNGLKHLIDLPITGLFMRSSPIDDSALDSIAKIKTLKQLEIGGTDVLIPTIAEKLKGLEHLISLDVAKSKACPQMEGIDKLRHLTYLKADDLRIDDIGIKRISQLKSLTTLDVQRNYFTDIGLLYLANVPKLSRVNLSHSSLCTDEGVDRLWQAKPGVEIINTQM